jgi:hypothetical protein
MCNDYTEPVLFALCGSDIIQRTMTVVLGVNLPRKVYLFSDTRLTTEKSDGSRTHSDDLLKFDVLNENTALVAAGDMKPAQYAIIELKKLLKPTSSIDYIRMVLEQNIQEIMSRYVNETGKHSGSFGFVIGGYNPHRPLKIDAGRLGQVMSANLVSRGEGSHMDYEMDMRIVTPLVKKIESLGKLGRKAERGTNITYSDIAESKVFGFKHNIRTNNFEIKDAGVYDHVIFQPKSDVFESITIPDELISKLEFREKGEGKKEALLLDTTTYMGEIMKYTSQGQFPTVGGNIFPVLVVPGAAIIQDMELLSFTPNGIETIGAIRVEESGIYYTLRDGKTGKYTLLKDYKPSSDDKLDI